LAKRAGLNPKTVANIEDGKPALDFKVAAIAIAFSQAMGRTIAVDDFEGVTIIRR
jgi:DNA-binding XRE family transcriptional regulator